MNCTDFFHFFLNAFGGRAPPVPADPGLLGPEPRPPSRYKRIRGKGGKGKEKVGNSIEGRKGRGGKDVKR